MLSPFAAFSGPDITETQECVKVWTDGSGSTKENEAAWAFVAEFKGKLYRAYGYLPQATVNEAAGAAVQV